MSNQQHDPDPDSLFELVDERSRCLGCGEFAPENSTEGRGLHLDHCKAWEAHCNGEKVPGWEADLVALRDTKQEHEKADALERELHDPGGA